MKSTGGDGGQSYEESCHDVAAAGNTVLITEGGEDQRIVIWLTPTSRREFPNDLGHRNVTVTGNVVCAASLERRGVFVPPEQSASS